MSNTNNVYVSIMAGGIGSRFWPASRNHRPKQFLDILGTGKSLLRQTYERFLQVCPSDHIFIVTNEQYRDLVKEHLPELSDQQILCEPSRNNTAPCITYAALKLHKINPEATMVVAPSDHLITNESAFAEQIKQAANFATRQDALLTLGIQPFQPHTGYGYIQYQKTATEAGIHRVDAFTEKPDQPTAQQFLEAGNYLWNAGIFIWQTRRILEALQQHANEIYQILHSGWEALNTDQEQTFIDQAYPTTPSISIDYAIMEKASNVYTLPSDFGWSDLGSWSSIYQIQEKDAHQNVVSQCESLLENTHNCLIHAAPDKLVVANGLDNFIIVDDNDVLLIFPRAAEQAIKKVTQQLESKSLGKFL